MFSIRTMSQTLQEMMPSISLGCVSGPAYAHFESKLMVVWADNVTGVFLLDIVGKPIVF